MRPNQPALLTISAVVILVVAAAPATAEETIDFDGAGWGHGVGMAQYGARALADGADSETGPYSASQITEYYYTGTSVQDASEVTSFPNPLWIGLIQDQKFVDFIPHGGMADLCLDGGCPFHAHDGELWRFELIGNNQCRYSRFDGQGFVAQGAAAACTGSITWPQPGVQIELPNQGSNDCTVPAGTPACYAWGTMYFRAHSSGNTFHQILEIDLEKYLYGVDEIPLEWSPEVQKAQALAARSYAVARAIGNAAMSPARLDLCWCHLYDDTRDQAYDAWGKELADANAGSPWKIAVDATAGQVITHDASATGVIAAFYSSSSGGRTENNEDIWGGSPLAWLRSVDDHWSLHPTADNPRASWTFSPSREIVEGAVGLDALASVVVSARYDSGSGSVKEVTYRGLDAVGQFVTVVKSGSWTKSTFGLYSRYFDVFETFSVGGAAPFGPDNVALHDPVTGIWHVRRADGSVASFYYGDPLDDPYGGDWDGDGVDTPGLYRRSTGFNFLRNSNTQGIADIEIYYGDPADMAISGDWNGDGVDTVGVWRPSEARFYLRNQNTQGVADISFPLGDPADIPVAGDWNGDGIDTVGVWRPSSVTLYLTNDHDSSVDFSWVYSNALPTDRLVVGDWDGNGVDTVGVYRPTDATFYLRDSYDQPTSNIQIEMGEAHMTPVAGYWDM